MNLYDMFIEIDVEPYDELVGDWPYTQLAKSILLGDTPAAHRLRMRLKDLPFGAADELRSKVWRRWARRFKAQAERAAYEYLAKHHGFPVDPCYLTAPKLGWEADDA